MTPCAELTTLPIYLSIPSASPSSHRFFSTIQQPTSTRLSHNTCSYTPNSSYSSRSHPTNKQTSNNHSHHGLLSALPRSPTPAPTSASLIRCQLPTSHNTPSTPTTAVTTHNACRQLPSLPWSSPDQASATSSQMRATPWQSPQPLSNLCSPRTITHTRPNHDYGFSYQSSRSYIAEPQLWRAHI